MTWANGTGKTPPDWAKYLVLADKWKVPPWELERLDWDDENVSTWIERGLLFENTRKRK